jgi:predicted transcriptional regulator
MSTTTIRVSTQTRETLHKLAEASGVSMQRVLDNALEIYRREHLLDQANAAYALLRDDPVVWEEIERERREWDATLSDGLESGENH